VNHDYLLSKIRCPSSLKKDLKQWLKAGVLDNGVFEDTEAGTPQGGVISPILANIALDGMARLVEIMYPQGTNNKPFARLVIYADNFVVISKDLRIIEQCKTAISEWLKPVGLEIKPEKTRVCHTLKPIQYEGKTEEQGFDFLGFNIRQYPAGRHKAGKINQNAVKEFLTHIKPSKKAVKAHTEVIKGVIKRHKTAPKSTLISKLNPIIRGWTNYYSGVVSTETFNKLDYTIWLMLRAWTDSRCGKASHDKLRKYFRPGTVKLSNGKERHETWLFKAEDGLTLWKHSYTPIVRHTLIRPDATPYDGNWTYWATRKGQAIDTPTRVAKLLKKQKGRCTWCGQYFTPSDLVEVDHIHPRSQGGKDEYKNLQLLHRHTRDDKTALDEERMLYS